MMKMKTALASLNLKTLLPFLLAIAFLLPSTTKGDLITSTCKQTPQFDLCVSTLRASPKSKTASVAELGIIVVDALKLKLVDALKQISTLEKTRKKLIKQLRECGEDYQITVDSIIPSIVDGLAKGDPKFAEEGLAGTVTEVDGCKNSLGKSPLTGVNKALHDLAAVALAIARLLL